MVVYKNVRENAQARDRLRDSCTVILEQLAILDTVPVGQLKNAGGHDVAICREVNQIVRLAERY